MSNETEIEDMSDVLADVLDDLIAMNYGVSGSYDCGDCPFVVEVTTSQEGIVDGISRIAARLMVNAPGVYWIEPSSPNEAGVGGLLFRIDVRGIWNDL